MHFLTIPAEIRCRIYSYLFQDLCVTKAPVIIHPDSDSTTSVAQRTSTSSSTAARIPSVSPHATTAEVGAEAAQIAASENNGTGQTQSASANSDKSSLVNLSILRTCRKCYDEAHGIFWATATFYVRTVEQHKLFTDLRMLPRLADIKKLALDCQLLTEWSPTLLSLVMRSLNVVSIIDITTPLRHSDLVRIEQRSNSIAQSGSDYSQIDQSPSLVLFRSLVVALEEPRASYILAHFDACHGKYTLQLNFRLQCRHVGQVVVPGAFPIAGIPHIHEECKVTYTFNA